MQIEESKIKAALDAAHKEAGHNAYFGNGFRMGVEFALKELENKDLSFFEIIRKMEKKENGSVRLFNETTEVKTSKKGGLITLRIDEDTTKELMKEFAPTNQADPKWAVFCVVVDCDEYQSI